MLPMKTSLTLLRYTLAAGAAFIVHPLTNVRADDDVIVNGANTTIQLRIDGIVIANGPADLNTTPLPSTLDLVGTRMFWSPRKAAFRVGAVSSNGSYGPWGVSQLGLYSFATGLDTRATGSYSFAAGYLSDASGDGSIAMGKWADTGYGPEIAIGTSAHAYNYSAALGQSVTADYTSTAIGHSTSATAFCSTALGVLNVADGEYATALGYFTTARAYGSTVVGRYNVPQGNPSMPVNTDAVFVVGNGTASYSRSDAFTVYKSGDAYFSGTLRVERRGDIPMFGEE